MAKWLLALALFLGGAAPAFAAVPITIAIGAAPPHVTKDGQGRQTAIIRAILKPCGYEARFRVLPFTRHWRAYENDPALDGVAHVPADLDLPGHRAGLGYVALQNGITYIAEGGFDPRDLSDLDGMRVAAFPAASAILPGLDEAKDHFVDYFEMARQDNQIKMLFAGRVDALLGDGMIFAHHVETLREAAARGEDMAFDATRHARFQPIFAPTPYAMVFRSAAIAADFERCFAALRDDGGIDEINRAFVARYADSLGGRYLAGQ